MFILENIDKNHINKAKFTKLIKKNESKIVDLFLNFVEILEDDNKDSLQNISSNFRNLKNLFLFKFDCLNFEKSINKFDIIENFNKYSFEEKKNFQIFFQCIIKSTTLTNALFWKTLRLILNIDI